MTKHLKKVQNRNSNLEFLRIICMLLIIAHHYAVHGYSDLELNYSANKYIIDFLALGGQIGVDIFILISGYFMVNSQITLRKLLKICTQIWFYSIVILLIFSFVLTPVTELNFKNVLRSVFPISYSLYGFATAYIIIMLFSPFINEMVKHLSKQKLELMIFLMIIVWSILPYFLFAETGFNEKVWFFVLYIIGAYLRLYRLDFKQKNRLITIAIASAICLTSLVIISNLLGAVTRKQVYLDNSTYFKGKNSIFILAISLGLLLFFLYKKENYSQTVNLISSATFGVYLIHDNPIMRPYLWMNIFHNPAFYESHFLILHALISVLSIYTVCTCIELIRQRTVEVLWNSCTDKMIERVSRENGIIHLFFKISDVRNGGGIMLAIGS